MATVYAGRLLLRDGEPDGWVAVEDGVLVDMDEGDPPEAPAAAGWIVPSFVNAHTHVADAFLRDVPGKPQAIPELVGPGGWKHRQLAVARRPRQGRGVHRYAQEMATTGTGAFVDFRENGLSGTRFLRDLCEGAPWMEMEGLEPLPVPGIVLGRPTLNDFDPEEAEELLEVADGIGLSGMRDFPDPDHLVDWAEACHKAGKPFAVHVSEDKPDDMDAVLALDPAFVVHMVHASPRDLQMAGDTGLPIVLCPRSNRFFGGRPPVEAMLQAGVPLAVGTDNGMLQEGDLRGELRLLHEMVPDLQVPDLLRIASYGGRDLLGVPDPAPGEPCDLVLLEDDPLHGPVQALVDDGGQD